MFSTYMYMYYDYEYLPLYVHVCVCATHVHGEYKTLDTCFEVEEHWLSGVRCGEG